MKKTSKRTGASRRSSPRSRRASPTPPAAARALAAFAAAAAELDARWYLFGAQAVAIYGVPRTTADLDVTIDLGDTPTTALVAAAARAGLDARIADPQFVAETRVLPVVHAVTGWPIDIVLAGPGLEHEFLAGARTMRVAGLRIPVIAPEHLVITKLLAGRAKDLEDIRALLRQRALLDHAALDAIVDAIERALDQRDLSPVLAALRRDVAR